MISKSHLFFLSACLGVACELAGFIFAQTSLVSPIIDSKTYFEPVYKEVTTEYQCWDNVSKLISCTNKSWVIDYWKSVTAENIIGYTKDGKDIKGFVNEEKGIIYKWDYDIKDRNMVEFGRCRDYEVEKGVCHEI